MVFDKKLNVLEYKKILATEAQGGSNLEMLCMTY